MRKINISGVLPKKVIEEMLGCGDVYFTSVRSPSDRSHISPSLISLFPIELPSRGEKIVIERGQTRDFGVNLGIGRKLPGFHFFGDANTTSARVGYSVDVLDSDGRMLPYQPSGNYLDSVSPQPAKGNLIARVKANRFRVELKPGDSIANVRIFYGDPEESMLDPRSLGNFLSAEGRLVPADELIIKLKRLGMRLNLRALVHNGSPGYVSGENADDRTDRTIRYEKGANDPNMFFRMIFPCESYLAEPGTLNLLYTHEIPNLTGNDAYGKPFVGFMRRKLSGSDVINGATMLEPEPPKRLAVEIQPSRETTLYHGQHICDVAFYRGCEDLEIKPHTSGNRSPLGKLFRLNGY